MRDPFSILEIEPTDDVEKIREAYHILAKKNHPDQFEDPGQQEAAHQRMVALNHAYEEALKDAGDQSRLFTRSLTCEEAVAAAREMYEKHGPEEGFRQLLRASGARSAAWYGTQGQMLLEMRQYESAEQSYREAVRMEPDNIEYRRGAFDALVALRQSQTLLGRVKKVLHLNGTKK